LHFEQYLTISPPNYLYLFFFLLACIILRFAFFSGNADLRFEGAGFLSGLSISSLITSSIVMGTCCLPLPARPIFNSFTESSPFILLLWLVGPTAPAACHSFHLRNIHHQSLLIVGGCAVCGHFSYPLMHLFRLALGINCH
jgi:hypothetical protein